MVQRRVRGSGGSLEGGGGRTSDKGSPPVLGRGGPATQERRLEAGQPHRTDGRNLKVKDPRRLLNVLVLVVGIGVGVGREADDGHRHAAAIEEHYAVVAGEGVERRVQAGPDGRGRTVSLELGGG